jgi:hypothetical protein
VAGWETGNEEKEGWGVWYGCSRGEGAEPAAGPNRRGAESSGAGTVEEAAVGQRVSKEQRERQGGAAMWAATIVHDDAAWGEATADMRAQSLCQAV